MKNDMLYTRVVTLRGCRVVGEDNGTITLEFDGVRPMESLSRHLRGIESALVDGDGMAVDQAVRLAEEICDATDRLLLRNLLQSRIA